MTNMMDGHLHVKKELIPYLEEVSCIANADTKEEYLFLKGQRLPGMVISAGIHPWKADVTTWESMETILKEAKVIGEIGLDNVWCLVNMGIQRKVFHRQLQFAMEHQKPVVLHTKGMEKEILDTIREYPNRYLVHWYSCEEWQEEYIKLGCWFTIGPDLMINNAVKQLCAKVALDKILIESDGLEGICWGQGAELAVNQYMDAMELHLENVAAEKGVEKQILLEQMHQNLKEFLG